MFKIWSQNLSQNRFNLILTPSGKADQLAFEDCWTSWLSSFLSAL
jgi:hypothetical protein